MPVTMEQVLAQLDKEEPDYEFAAQLGPEVLPHLIHLVQGNDLGRASKATCLASFIDAEQSATVLNIAAHSPHPALRTAAAVSLSNLKEISPDLVTDLLNDENVGVRKWTLKALEIHRPTEVKAKVQEIAKSDPDMMLRQLAGQIVA